MDDLMRAYDNLLDDIYLQHYGVEGMKWGVRNYQNKDGSLTPLGRKHYGVGELSAVNRDISVNKANKYVNDQKEKHYKTIAKQENKSLKEVRKEYKGKEVITEADKRAYEKAVKEITDSAYEARRIVDSWANAMYEGYSYADVKMDTTYQDLVEKGKIKAEKQAQAIDAKLSGAEKVLIGAGTIYLISKLRKLGKKNG